MAEDMNQVGQRTRRIPPPALGELLAAARLRVGWKRREAARLLGISATYLFNLEASRRCPSMTMARRLADALPLTGAERAVLFASAVGDAGLDNPIRRPS